MSHDPSRSSTTYLSDFDDEDLVKRLQSKGYQVSKNGKLTANDDLDVLEVTPEWIEDEADALFRLYPDLPKPAQRFLARIIGSVQP